jgi:serine phosphatase RsbU (regulator of sigma subunit)
MAQLRDLNEENSFPLREKITLIGRAPTCDIIVGTNQTSGRHAVILHSNGGYSLEDLDSSNGTFLNGKRISKRTRLRPGDRIEIPGLTAAFIDEENGAELDEPVVTAEAAAPREGPATPIFSALALGEDLRPQVAPEAKLRAILEISRNLANTLDLDLLLPKILDSLFAIFPQAERGFILLRDRQSGQLIPGAVKQRQGQPAGPLPVSQTILQRALKTGQALLSADAATDERFDPTRSINLHQIRSIMCVPLTGRDGASLGALQIDTRQAHQPFGQEDLDVLVCASTQAARAVELAGLHQEQRELEAASQIQKSFLPAGRPEVPGLWFFDHYLPARHIGGDYFDYIPLPGNRLAVALGDVAGKGVPAALLMARLATAARFCLTTAPRPSEAVRRLDTALTRAGSEERFITFVVAVLDLKDFTLTLVNAGHPPPVLCRAGSNRVELLGEEIVGMPLAVIAQPHPEQVVSLAPGDSVILYTDGVTEARNPAGELYGVERLYQAIQAAPPGASGPGPALAGDVRRFAGDRPQADDLTIVCFGRPGK